MKQYTPLLIIGFILYIAIGDNIPGPLGKTSAQIRNGANDFLVGLFPTGKPRTKPYERTERQLEEIDKKR